MSVFHWASAFHLLCKTTQGGAVWLEVSSAQDSGVRLGTIRGVLLLLHRALWKFTTKMPSRFPVFPLLLIMIMPSPT